MSKQELSQKVKELKELKAMLEELEAEITTIEDSIKADMTAQGVEELTTDLFKIRYKTVKSSRFDSTAFKSTHAELYTQYLKETVTRRFSIA